MASGEYDISQEVLTWALERSAFPEVLMELVQLARRHFGWFSKHCPRAFEYPWVFSKTIDRAGTRILDIGSGVSPLPILLAKHLAKVLTVDHSPVIRRLGEDQEHWNGWGFLDYSCLDQTIQSLHADILKVEFAEGCFDLVYSVSVIEHMSASVRRELWPKAWRWLDAGGSFLLTLDLVPQTDDLWNYNQSVPVESIEEHGALATVEKELQQAGFELVECQVVRGLPQSKTDCGMLHFSKRRSPHGVPAPS